MNRALLTINTNDMMSSNTRDSFKDASNRWNCDYVEIVKAPPNTAYHHAALKLVAFDLCPHDRIFLLDSDTIVSEDAPNIFELEDEKYYSAVHNQQHHIPYLYKLPNVGIAREVIGNILAQKTVYKQINIDYLSNKFFNTGVTLISREYHKEVLEFAFYLFDGVANVQWWDQIPLNIAVNTILGNYHDIGVMWNFQMPAGIVMKNPNKMKVYIYHFAGNPNRYEILKTINWRS